jgi:hypothetical protein
MMKDRQQQRPARTSPAAPVTLQVGSQTITATPATPTEALQSDIDSLRSLLKKLAATAKQGQRASGPLADDIQMAQAALSLSRLAAALAGGAPVTPAQRRQITAMRQKLERVVEQERTRTV